MKLYHGDCLVEMAKIPDGSVDLTVTSPPYDNLRTYNGNNALWGEHVWKAVIKDLFRVTKKGGVVVWVVGDATIKGSETGTSFKQALWAMECGFNLHDTMIWEKEAFSNPFPNRYHQVFEYMFIFCKGKIALFNGISDRKNKHAGKTVSSTVREADGSLHKRKPKLINDYGKRFNVWKQTVKKQRGGHPAPFPISLVNDHIISWSNENNTILDPFMGSGTTGVACVNLNRNFIGIEMDDTYFNDAKDRIEQAKNLFSEAV